MHRLEILGHVPSSKNKLRPGRGGSKFHYDSGTRAQLDALVTQARIQWGPRSPLEHPNVIWQFWLRDAKGDRNNKKQTMLDVLKKAGVIVDDNVRRYNGIETERACLYPFPEERCVVEFGSLDEYLRRMKELGD